MLLLYVTPNFRCDEVTQMTQLMVCRRRMPFQCLNFQRLSVLTHFAFKSERLRNLVESDQRRVSDVVQDVRRQLELLRAAGIVTHSW